MGETKKVHKGAKVSWEFESQAAPDRLASLPSLLQ